MTDKTRSRGGFTVLLATTALAAASAAGCGGDEEEPSGRGTDGATQTETETEATVDTGQQAGPETRRQIERVVRRYLAAVVDQDAREVCALRTDERNAEAIASHGGGSCPSAQRRLYRTPGAQVDDATRESFENASIDEVEMDLPDEDSATVTLYFDPSPLVAGTQSLRLEHVDGRWLIASEIGADE